MFRLVDVKNLCNMPIIAMYCVLFFCILHKTDFGSDFGGSNFQRVCTGGLERGSFENSFFGVIFGCRTMF